MTDIYRLSPASQDSLEQLQLTAGTYINPTQEAPLDNNANYMADLSMLRHRLLIGEKAKAWLTQQGIDNLPAPGQCVQLEEQALLSCESDSRYYLVDGFSADHFPSNINECHQQCLFIDYECLDIALGGEDIDTIFSEATNINYRERNEHDWITTLFARAEVWIKKTSINGRMHYRLGAAPADGAYLYHYLVTLLDEINGSVIDFETYKKLIKARV